MIAAFLLGVLCGVCIFIYGFQSWFKKNSTSKTIIEFDGKKYIIAEVIE
jgi:hypothetical protein